MNDMPHAGPNETAGHPAEASVLLLLDGELDAGEACDIALHLDVCDPCRAGMEKLRRGMDAFVEFKQAECLRAAGAHPNRWSEFESLLDQISNDLPEAGAHA